MRVELSGAEAQTLLARPVEEVYKQDHRSRVWRVRDEAGRAWVVKRFEHDVVKQRWTAAVGRHPAQLEAGWHRRLAAKGLPVVPVAGRGGGDAAGRRWLITPWRGETLDRLVMEGELAQQPGRRRELAVGVGTLVGQLAAAGVYHKDCKAANLVVDTGGGLWLIDVGGCRRSGLGRRREHVRRMADLLRRTVEQAVVEAGRGGWGGRGLSRAERWRFCRAVGSASRRRAIKPAALMRGWGSGSGA